jgi:RNA polymerase sigma factor (sigma-70 family)
VSIFHQQPGLLLRFRRGDTDALAAVYWHYVAAVSAVVRRSGLLSRHNAATYSEELMDLVQETFTRAFSDAARSAYDGIRDYRPYLLQICRNLLSSLARRRGREILSQELDEHPDEPSQAPPFAAHELRIVHEYLQALTPDLRSVYEQRYVLGRTQREASAALGISRQGLRTRETRLRKGLEEALDQCEEPAFCSPLRRTDGA